MFKKIAVMLFAATLLVGLPNLATQSYAGGFGLPATPNLPKAVGAGEQVTVAPISPAVPGKATYKWFIGGKQVAKVTSATIKIPAGTIGKALQVQQYSTVGKKTNLVGLSTPLTIGTQSIPSLPTIVFGSSASTELSVILPSNNVPANATASYTWHHGGIEIAGATKPTYTYAETERGLLISVGITYKKPGYKDKTVYSQDLQIPALPKNYKLLWSDEFNSPTLNSAVWAPQNGDGTEYHNRGWGNNERQWYLLQNSTIDSAGNLNMLATQTGASQYNCYYGKCEWLSSKLVTLNKVGFKYGHLEARIKAAPGAGSWGAFWMLGANIDDRGWPGCGEIDVTEILGRDINTTYGTLHGPMSGGGGRGDKATLPASLADGWHTYAVDWLPDSITWTVDGVEYAKQTKTDADWVFDHEFYVILNLAMGGGFGGQIDPTLKQSTMSFDYVRFYSINGVGEVINH